MFINLLERNNRKIHWWPPIVHGFTRTHSCLQFSSKTFPVCRFSSIPRTIFSLMQALTNLLFLEIITLNYDKHFALYLKYGICSLELIWVSCALAYRCTHFKGMHDAWVRWKGNAPWCLKSYYMGKRVAASTTLKTWMGWNHITSQWVWSGNEPGRRRIVITRKVFGPLNLLGWKILPSFDLPRSLRTNK